MTSSDLHYFVKLCSGGGGGGYLDLILIYRLGKTFHLITKAMMIGLSPSLMRGEFVSVFSKSLGFSAIPVSITFFATSDPGPFINGGDLIRFSFLSSLTS